MNGNMYPRHEAEETKQLKRGKVRGEAASIGEVIEVPLMKYCYVAAWKQRIHNAH